MREGRWWLALVLAGLLGAMWAKGLLVQPPTARAHNSSGQFDAGRAKARLGFIIGDQRPHPTDTAGDDTVRARLVATLGQMGLKPVVRDQFACNELFKERGVSCARVRNVIAILGPQAGKALLLNAHYDSTPVGPAAADDGIGVATLLEVASIVKGQPLKRPVILLFNEGEELGLVGARAFLADPLSQQVDSLINHEARGVRGPVNMFETSRPNSAPIAVYGAAVEHPVANSLSTDVYQLLPNYTDVNSFAERGWLTLNLAPIGNETRYHSPGDDLAALDLATLQHMGDQTLALTEALANGSPKASDGDRIFMDVSGRALISLPLIAGAVLLIILLLGFGWLTFTRGGYWRSGAVVLGTIFGSGALSWVALFVIGAIRRGMFWRAEPVWTHLANYASVMFVAAALLAGVGRRSEPGQLRVAFWLVLVAVGALIGLVAPNGIIFFLFPPLIALLGILAARWWRPAEMIGSLLAILFLYFTWGAMLALLEELLNSGPMWVFAPLGALLILPVLIEAKPLMSRAGASLAALLALIGWAAAAAAPAYSADREQRFVIEHVTDASSGKSSSSILNDGAPLPSAYGTVWHRGKLPFSDRPRWLAPALTGPNDKAPEVQLVSHIQNGNQRTLVLRLTMNGNEAVELVAPANSQISAAGTAGFVRPVDQNEEGRYYLGCFGRSCDGASLELVIDQPKPVQLLIVGSRPELPPAARPLIAGRPKFARPQYNRDESISFARLTL